jgi:hypothetical protein
LFRCAGKNIDFLGCSIDVVGEKRKLATLFENFVADKCIGFISGH